MTVQDETSRSTADTERELREALEKGGHRFTTQRAAVYEALQGTLDHPTADEIFTSVRERIPDISLATVYKALEAFVNCGLARKLSMGEGPARFDHRTDEHHHVRCVSCGRVEDVGPVGISGWLEDLETETDFEVAGYRLELLGTCSRCRN